MNRIPESVDLNEIVRSTLQLLHSELINRRIKVTCTLDSGLRPTRGDRVQLQQVLLNLMMNSADSMNDQTAVATLDSDCNARFERTRNRDHRCRSGNRPVAHPTAADFPAILHNQGAWHGAWIVDMLIDHQGPWRIAWP